MINVSEFICVYMYLAGCLCVCVCVCVCVYVCVCVCPGPLCGDSWCGSDPGWKEASCFFMSPFPQFPGPFGSSQVSSASGSENQGDMFWDRVGNSLCVCKNVPHL